MKVIFRVFTYTDEDYVWPGDVIALFPECPGDIHGNFCNSYQHIGQHGAACYRVVVDGSRPATPEEYRDLLGELERIGYTDIEVRHRATPQDHEKRRQTARE